MLQENQNSVQYSVDDQVNIGHIVFIRLQRTVQEVNDNVVVCI